MKKLIFSVILAAPIFLHAQFGVKGGLNFAKVSKASEINSDTKSGFHLGLFLAPPSKSLISSRTEIMFSRQGYNYKTTNTGTVDLDYIQLGQLMSINITKFFSLMFGAQTAYLVSASVDSSNASGTNGTENQMMDLMNRIDYGYAIGGEVHPISGLVIGIRYNVSLAKIYKDVQSFQMPSFTAEDAQNNLIMLSVGWRFGGGKKDEKK
jgi:hypothetical protein